MGNHSSLLWYSICAIRSLQFLLHYQPTHDNEWKWYPQDITPYPQYIDYMLWEWLHPLYMLGKIPLIWQIKLCDIKQRIEAYQLLFFLIKSFILSPEYLEIFSTWSYHYHGQTCSFEIHTDTRSNQQSWLSEEKKPRPSLRDDKSRSPKYEMFFMDARFISDGVSYGTLSKWIMYLQQL